MSEFFAALNLFPERFASRVSYRGMNELMIVLHRYVGIRIRQTKLRYIDKLFSLFSFSNRILQEGLPLILCASIFAAVGVALLILTRDSLIQMIVKKLRRRI